MTDEQKRLKIAHACGWREAFPQHGEPHPETRKAGILLPYKWVNERTSKRVQELPDYLNDLNAMADAESVLDDNSLRYDYAHALYNIITLAEIQPFRASARQRADAFVFVLERIAELTPTPKA